MAKANPLLSILRDACIGLNYPSESDNTFQAFIWPGKDATPTGNDVVESSGSAKGSPVAEITLTDFFRAIPKSARGDFLTLTTSIVDHLQKVKVFKVGSVKMTAYIVGITADGKWAGVKTDLVET